MRFDLTDLRLFLQVVETSSITLGAQQANLALASASARIRGMETHLAQPCSNADRGASSQLQPAARWSITRGSCCNNLKTCAENSVNTQEA